MNALTTMLCICPSSPLICGTCGGALSQTDSILSKIEPENLAWIYELDSKSRLNSTLASFKSIDKQYQAGSAIGEVVSKAIREIAASFSDMPSQIRETIHTVVIEQTDQLVTLAKVLQEQGKSFSEIHTMLKEATGSVQTALTALQIPTIKGEEGEVLTMTSLQDAFLGVAGIKVEPAGGPDETDGIVRFFHSEIEVGRALVEVKSRKVWSNNFLIQIRSDMQRYNAPMALIVTDKLPRNAKGRGFVVDSEVGLTVITTQDLLIPTITMFLEIQTMVYKLQRRVLDLASLSANTDLVHHINDNMNCLEDCKRIIDAAKNSSMKIERLAASIMKRIQTNNGMIADILTKFSKERPI